MSCSRLGRDLDMQDNGRVLGSGAFGTVYVGTLLSKQRHVAVKIMKKLANEMERHEKDNVLNEIKTNALVKHPYCVSLEGVSIGPNMEIQIVQEWCEGGDLQDMMRQKPQLLFLRFWTYAKQLASALKHLHFKRIVHLDIKPANVLLTKGYASCKFCDFGMGKQLTKSQDLQMEQGRGTACYMAPEMFQKREFTGNYTRHVEMHQGTYRKPDIYSLAILLLQMFRPQLHRNRGVCSQESDFVIFDRYPQIPVQIGLEVREKGLRPSIYNQVCQRFLQDMRLDCNSNLAFVCGCCRCVLNMPSALRMTPVLSFLSNPTFKVAGNGRIATIPLAVKY
jgi:serine/threonine protein kinase